MLTRHCYKEHPNIFPPLGSRGRGGVVKEAAPGFSEPHLVPAAHNDGPGPDPQMTSSKQPANPLHRKEPPKWRLHLRTHGIPGNSPGFEDTRNALAGAFTPIKSCRHQKSQTRLPSRRRSRGRRHGRTRSIRGPAAASTTPGTRVFTTCISSRA
jgi:hypothetical protein